MRKLICVLAAVVLAVGLLAGCGGTAQNGGGKVLRVGGITVDTLSPLTMYVAGSFEIALLVYDPLVRIGEDLQPTPCLAESWDVSDDGLVWTFHLVKNAKWHDGEPVTSADVKFTYDLMIDNNVGYLFSSLLGGIEDITCPDDYTVVMTTAAPKADMLRSNTPILPEHIWSKIPKDQLELELNEHPIGSGPFKFESKDDANTNWTLVRNDDYFGPKPNIDSVVFIYYANPDSMTQAIKTGEIDALFASKGAQLAPLQSDPNVFAVGAKIPAFTEIGINVFPDGKGNPLLRDVNVRYAMEYALDRQKIVDMVFYGNASPGSTIMSPVGGWHYEVPASDYRSYDPDKANAILDAAGYTKRNAEGTRLAPDGSPLEFNMIYSADVPERGKIAAFLKSGCADIGIKINNSLMDSDAIADAIADYNYDMYIWHWYEDADPTSLLSIFTKAELNACNETGWTDPLYEELYVKQQQQINVDERLATIQEMQKIAYAACQFIVVVNDEDIQAIRQDKWTGYQQVPDDGALFINNTIVNYMTVKPK